MQVERLTEQRLRRDDPFCPTGVHNPSATLSETKIKELGYVMPIVDHAKMRVKAIEAYKEAAARG